MRECTNRTFMDSIRLSGGKLDPLLFRSLILLKTMKETALHLFFNRKKTNVEITY